MIHNHPYLVMRSGFYQLISTADATVAGLILEPIAPPTTPPLAAHNRALRQVMERMAIWFDFYDGYVAGEVNGQRFLVAGFDAFIDMRGHNLGPERRYRLLHQTPTADGEIVDHSTRGLYPMGEVPTVLRHRLASNCTIL